jgi:hypothetical protein
VHDIRIQSLGFHRRTDGFEARLPLQLHSRCARVRCRGRRDDAEYRAPMAPVALQPRPRCARVRCRGRRDDAEYRAPMAPVALQPRPRCARVRCRGRRDDAEYRVPMAPVALQPRPRCARVRCRGRRDDAEYRAPMASVALQLGLVVTGTGATLNIGRRWRRWRSSLTLAALEFAVAGDMREHERAGGCSFCYLQLRLSACRP